MNDDRYCIDTKSLFEDESVNPNPNFFQFIEFRSLDPVPFQALAAQVEAKLLDQTLTLKLASNLAAKVVGDHLQSGLGRGHDDRAAHPQQFAAPSCFVSFNK